MRKRTMHDRSAISGRSLIFGIQSDVFRYECVSQSHFIAKLSFHSRRVYLIYVI